MWYSLYMYNMQEKRNEKPLSLVPVMEKNSGKQVYRLFDDKSKGLRKKSLLETRHVSWSG